MRAKRARKILGHAHLLTGKVKVQIVTDHVLNVASELVKDFRPNEDKYLSSKLYFCSR